MLAPLGPRSAPPYLWRRVLAALVVACTVVAFVLQAQAARADTVRTPRAFFGIHDGSLRAYDTLDYGSLRLWDVGVTWREIETSPGVYDWSRLDALVSAAQQHGVEVTLVLAMTPSFYGPASTLPPTELTAYGDYVRAVMARYRDFNGRRGIAAYEVWNEGNVPTFWTGTPAQLARLTTIVWHARQQVDPGATVVGPSFALRLADQRRWLSDYTSQRVEGRPVWRYYDATGLSLYPRATYGDRIGGPEDAMALLTKARKRLAAAGAPADQPIWGTEVNYGVTSDASAATPISAQRQVANVIRTYLLGAAQGLQRMFWYRYDWGLVPGGTLGNTLLATPGSPGEITPAGQAVATAEDWLKGRLVGRHGQAPCHRDAAGTFTCVVRHAGGVRTILWNPRHRVRVPMPRGAADVQNARGVTSRIDGRQSTLAVSYLPVMVNSHH
jgi:hypothetical protein